MPPYGGASTYRNSQAGQSSASLISSRGGEDSEGSRDDDEARLTSNASGTAGWPEDLSVDTERTGGLTPRTRQRTVRYSTSPSPLKRTGSAFKNMSKGIRRVSLRVVNLAGADDSVRLKDEEDERKAGDDKEEDLPDLRKDLPIRGRTLGFFGPQSRIRLGLFHFLVHP